MQVPSRQVTNYILLLKATIWEKNGKTPDTKTPKTRIQKWIR